MVVSKDAADLEQQVQVTTSKMLIVFLFLTYPWVAFSLSALMRVNRALRATHSRRQVNRFIDQGRLTVNGVVVSSSDDRLKAGDIVKLDGTIQVWEEDDLPQHRYIKFHKPAGVVTTTDRRIPNNILDALETAQQQGNETNVRRVYPIGRLDADSVGLILLTSDGSIVNPLLRTNSDKTKEYHVETTPPYRLRP